MSTHVPAPAPDPGALPHSLTFFLNSRERRDVLRELKRLESDRSRALLGALKIAPDRREGTPDG